MEIRLHGRGGQGGVTCAKILAAVYARSGRSVQTFGDYSGERSGAPVRAYTRVSDAPITNRNKVYEPDQLLVLDPGLLGPDVLAGLKPGGTLLLNTPLPIEEFAGEFPGCVLATVDATAIARARGIGSRSVVIVNTTIAGAYMAVHDLPLDILRDTYETLGLLSNFDAAREAYDRVEMRPCEAPRGSPAGPGETTVSTPAPREVTPREVMPLEAHIESQPVGLQTGSWGAVKPQYVENLAPCNAWCPAGNDVLAFVQSMTTEDLPAAAKILGASSPLAATCGRVCPAPCMEGCNRREYDGAVNIRSLERYIADAAPVACTEIDAGADPQRIAIVGGGPAGLTAAYTLARAGHHPTIYDGEDALGGVLHTGIPSYRLPPEVVEREVAGIVGLGVGVRCGTFLSKPDLERLADDYDAVILATGLQKLRSLGIRGQALAGVEQGIHFLHRVNRQGASGLAGHVVVLGGGNTAMDCARCALRAGAERVTVAYRRTRAEMPAIREEVEAAIEEGITVLEQRQPTRFTRHGTAGTAGTADDADDGVERVDGVELAEVEMGTPDASGRRRPVVTDRVTHLACDYVLLALGQSADLSLLPASWELRGEQVYRENTPLAVFGAGDVATGDGTVTHAIGSGRRAAGLALRALGVDGVTVFERPDRERAVPATDIRFDHFTRRPPQLGATQPAAVRRATMTEVNHGIPDAGEAHRCFSCGHCTQCDTCLVYCPEGIIRRQAPGYAVDYTYCKGCGICVEECPRRAMEMNSG